jgi:hypothetical protein
VVGISLARAFQPPHDAIHHPLQPPGSTTPAQRDLHGAQQLSRSNGSRCPVVFTTRQLAQLHALERREAGAQFGHRRRARIRAALSSVGRESLTCVSSFAQNGQRMTAPSLFSPRLYYFRP